MAHIGSRTRSVAFVISSHGFGHASRASAIIEAMRDRDPGLVVELFTQVPRWYFSQSIGNFNYHRTDCDLGLVQTDSLNADVGATIIELGKRLPLDPKKVKALATQFQALKCQLVISDIAPLGLVAARVAGIPSVLVENFTWDWIYAGLAERAPGLRYYSELLAPLFTHADLRIQTTPVCVPVSHAKTTRPVARRQRQDRATTRGKLGLERGRKLVFITMGGTAQDFSFHERLCSDFRGIDFVVAGIGTSAETHANVTFLPAQSTMYHPDLIHAADIVIGKVGYSTIAEVFEAGVPFGYFVREHYPEMAPLVTFLRAQVPGFDFKAAEYIGGQWLDRLPQLLAMEPLDRRGVGSGATECASLISAML